MGSPAMSRTEPVTPAQACLDRHAAGDATAYADLIRATGDRLLLIVRGLLTRYAKLRRWVESGDVLQNVLIRLDRTLSQIRPPTTREFLALAATNVRRELIDLARHYFGPEGVGANHATPPATTDGLEAFDRPGADDRGDPALLAEWVELHEQIDNLPDDLREVVDLHWYHGMSQPEVAGAVGVSLKTVKRRWASARVLLGGLLSHDAPP
jgi:RNA polymerase sigma-70 factor (ECF subfamily)